MSIDWTAPYRDALATAALGHNARPDAIGLSTLRRLYEPTPAQLHVEQWLREDSLRQSLIERAYPLAPARGIDAMIGVRTAQRATEAARSSVEAFAREQAALALDQTRSTRVGAYQSVMDLIHARTLTASAAAEHLSAVGYAQEQARLAQTMHLTAGLEAYRTTSDLLSLKLLTMDGFGVAHAAANLEPFSQASAMADMIGQSLRVDSDLIGATQAYTLARLPDLVTLSDHRRFLDAAGLHLPRWPRWRLLSTAERRQRLKAKLKSNAEPPAVKKAKSLVHRYELTLREILDAVMADAYGEGWAEARLPQCDCKDLLGRWRSRGGEVLDHADYHHYAKIMGHPEHFERIFEAGFDDPEALATLLKDAGRLRAASHHGRGFTAEDLRALRVTWLTLETGLLAFTPDLEVDGFA